jgi:hypothetical protein
MVLCVPTMTLVHRVAEMCSNNDFSSWVLSSSRKNMKDTHTHTHGQAHKVSFALAQG